MANYATLKAAINQYITTNGNNEITGAILNNILDAMVDSLGANYGLGGVATPSTNPGTPDQNVFYLAFEAGTYTNFNNTVLPAGISTLMWNGSWTAQTWYTIDAKPTYNSNNFVKSGGVYEELALGAVYDVTAHNSGATFASLSALLSNANLNTLIPTSVRKGGMSIKFVQSSDNNYVQYRLMSDTFSTTESDWQGVDAEPTAGSKNLVESGGVYEKTKKLDAYSYGSTSSSKKAIVIKGDNNENIVVVSENGIDVKALLIRGSDIETILSEFENDVDNTIEEFSSTIENKQDKISNLNQSIDSSYRQLLEIYNDEKTELYCSVGPNGIYAKDYKNAYGKIDQRLFERYCLYDFILDKTVFNQNKTAVFFGDSIAYGVGASSNSKRFSTLLCNMAGFVETNHASSGSVFDPEIASAKGQGCIVTSIEMTTISNYDYVFIEGGTNDVAYDIEQSRLYNVILSLCQWLDNNKGNAKIFFITPINKVNQKGNNCTVDGARRAISEAAVQYGFNILNGGDIPFPSYNSYWKNVVLPDGIHPSDIGHSIFAKCLFNKLNKQ